MLKAIRNFCKASALLMLGFLVVGMIALVIVVLIRNQHRYALEQCRSITFQLDRFVDIVYEHKDKTSGYPNDLSELSSKLPDDDQKRDLTKRLKSKFILQLGRTDYSGDELTWTYFPPVGSDPPRLFCGRGLGSHRSLMYEFRASKRSYFPPENDEGWTLDDEGNKVYLRSLKK